MSDANQVLPDDDVIERPVLAAPALGVSLSTFWRRQHDNRDPDFPKVVHLGGRVSGIRRGDRRRYIAKKFGERGA